MAHVLLRIGEFARIVGLPVRTVRYYGDIGLLAPTETDPSSGYRYYDLDRVETARRLLTLKELGLSLDEIGTVLGDRLDAPSFRRLLEAHVDRLEAEHRRTEEQLDRARAHLQSLEDQQKRMERSMSDITIKTSEAKTIAYIRQQIDDISAIGPMFPRLFESVDPAHAVGVAGNIYHEFADDGSFIDLEAALPVADDYQPSGEAKVRRIEPTQVAVYTHRGAFNRLHEAHETIQRWIAANGYEVAGPSYEWNLVCTQPVTQDNESYVTEIHVEVAPAS